LAQFPAQFSVLAVPTDVPTAVPIPTAVPNLLPMSDGTSDVPIPAIKMFPVAVPTAV
jgi:hypothetical protein